MARQLRSVAQMLAPAVIEAVRDLTLTPADGAAVQLAGQYARAIDGAPEDDRADVLRDLGPKLLACLIELGATPKARAAVNGGPADASQSPLTRLREARRV